MNYLTWFLVIARGYQYLGPMSEAACKQAEIALRYEGFVCRQATALTSCPAPGYGPGVYTTCPVFDFPKVTVKP